MVRWKEFYSYQVFDDFINKFLINKKSFITRHPETLDIPGGLGEINKCFIENYDESKDKDFGAKVSAQFSRASLNAKIIFANIEYLWSMPVSSISRATKLSYVKRWFTEEEIEVGEKHFFNSPHTIANPGTYYNLNKYHELKAIILLFQYILRNKNDLSNISQVKRIIEDFAFSGIYPLNNGLNDEYSEYYIQGRSCAIFNVLLHLCDPEKYEGIISLRHKKMIVDTFVQYLEKTIDDSNPEKQIKEIKEKIFNKYALGDDPIYKARWFFYRDGVRELWKGKDNKKKSKKKASVKREKENLTEAEEGMLKEKKVMLRIRNRRLVEERKNKDKYVCKACGFKLKLPNGNFLIEVHHKRPLSYYENNYITNIDDLECLCPVCHRIAHHSRENILTIEEIKEIRGNINYIDLSL